MKQILAALAFCAALIAGAVPAMAQQPQQVRPCVPATSANGFTTTCTDATAANPFPISGPVTTTPATPAPGTAGAGYPAGATAVTNNASGTTGAVAATLPAAAGKFTYLCGLYVTGTTATAANATAVTAVSNATTLFSSLIAHPVTPALGSLGPPPFGPCLQGSAVNTSIVVTSAADAAGSNVTVSAWGYQQ